MLAKCGRLVLVPIAVVALGVGALGCDEAEEVGEDIREGVEDATARATAETFRGTLRAQDTDDATGGVRNIDALNSAAEDLPGDQRACVELPESGNEIDVTGDPCF